MPITNSYGIVGQYREKAMDRGVWRAIAMSAMS